MEIFLVLEPDSILSFLVAEM